MSEAVNAIDYPNMRFLIADDKAFIRSIVQRMLMKLRAKFVIQAANDDVEVENTRRIALTEIAPGAVLAQDVHAADRGLLVAAGTSLKSGLIARLKELTEGGGENMRLWVGDRVKSPPA